MIGMNNDRAGSFLCSFQTFQTFNSVVRTGRLGACACTTRDTEHLPGGVQPNLRLPRYSTVLCMWILQRAWATFSCSNFNFAEGTDRRPFLQHVGLFFIQLSTQAPKHPSSPVSSEENQSSPFSPTWRAGMLLSLSPFGPRPSTHHILPLLPPARPSMVGQRIPTINRCQPEADNHQIQYVPKP